MQNKKKIIADTINALPVGEGKALTEQEKSEINKILCTPGGGLMPTLYKYEDFSDADWQQAKNRANRKGQKVVDISTMADEEVKRFISEKEKHFERLKRKISEMDISEHQRDILRDTLDKVKRSHFVGYGLGK